MYLKGGSKEGVHIVFFGRIPVVLESRAVISGGRGVNPLHPPNRSAPDLSLHIILHVCSICSIGSFSSFFWGGGEWGDM